MKYYPRLNVYKASNLFFDPVTLQGTSYEWYHIVMPIKGKLLFNDYNYSPTTIKHRIKLRALLSELNISIDHNIEAPRGLLQLPFAIGHYEKKIAALQEEIDKPRSQAKKNNERRALINQHTYAINIINQLL